MMAEAPSQRPGAWVLPTVLAAVALAILHHPLSYNLARTPMFGSDNEGLGLAALALAIGVAWQRRDVLEGLLLSPGRAGWALVVLGGIFALVGHQQEMRLPLAFSLPLIVAGGLWVVCGRQWAAALWFPLLLLAAIVPLPAEINKAFSFPMQAIAARFAAIVVDLLGTPVQREGVTLVVGGRTILVSEGCSGWRTFTGAFWLFMVFTYWQQLSRWWHWFGYLALLLPIAITANTLRVITVVAGAARGQGWLLVSPWHELVGFAYFIPLAWLLMSLTNPAPAAPEAGVTEAADGDGEGDGESGEALGDEPALDGHLNVPVEPSPTSEAEAAAAPDPPLRGASAPPPAGLWRVAVVLWLFALGSFGAALQARVASHAPAPPSALPERLGDWQRSRPAPVDGGAEKGEWQSSTTYRHSRGTEALVLLHMPFAQRRRLARPVNFWLKQGREMVGMETVDVGTPQDPRPVRLATFTKGREHIAVAVAYLRPGRVTDSYIQARFLRSAEQLFRGRPHAWVSVSVSAPDPQSALGLVREILPVAQEWVARAEGGGPVATEE